MGKTVLGIYLAAQRRCSTLVLVHRRPLLDQWKVQLALFLDVDEVAIGEIGRGKQHATKRLDIAMLQSVTRKDSVDDRVTAYDQVIVDECHHMPAVSFSEHVLPRSGPVTSSASRRRLSDATAIIPSPRCNSVSVRYTADRRAGDGRPFRARLIIRETQFRLVSEQASLPIQALYRELAADPVRNDLILADVFRAIDEGRSPILLTERKDHLAFFAERLRGFVKHLIVLQGGKTEKERRASGAALAAIPDTEERLAASGMIGEGFTTRAWIRFWHSPSPEGRCTHRRLHRPSPEDGRPDLDYVDRAAPMLQRCSSASRYRAIGWNRGQRFIASSRGERASRRQRLMPEPPR
jgi:hypothetical protein